MAKLILTETEQRFIQENLLPSLQEYIELELWKDSFSTFSEKQAKSFWNKITSLPVLSAHFDNPQNEKLYPNRMQKSFPEEEQ